GMCGHPRARDAVSVGFVRRESGGWLVTHAPWHSPCSVGQGNLLDLARTVCNSAPRWAGTLQGGGEQEIATGRLAGWPNLRRGARSERERDRLDGDHDTLRVTPTLNRRFRWRCSGILRDLRLCLVHPSVAISARARTLPIFVEIKPSGGLQIDSP